MSDSPISAAAESSRLAPDALAAPELAGSSAGDGEAFDLIELVRERLSLSDSLADVTIAASLAQIAGRSEGRERWLAAFGSPLGKHLASRGSDLNTEINVLLALAPRSNT